MSKTPLTRTSSFGRFLASAKASLGRPTSRRHVPRKFTDVTKFTYKTRRDLEELIIKIIEGR